MDTEWKMSWFQGIYTRFTCYWIIFETVIPHSAVNVGCSQSNYATYTRVIDILSKSLELYPNYFPPCKIT